MLKETKKILLSLVIERIYSLGVLVKSELNLCKFLALLIYELG